MPPFRRDRARPSATPPPYTNGWLWRHQQRHRTRRAGAEGKKALPGVSSSATDIVRCGATCSHSVNAVATHADAISRSLPPPAQFLPHLALGFFHQEARAPRASPALPPRFVPTEAASRLLGPRPQLEHVAAGLFDHARPVASRNGRVVLELRREARADGLTLSVCNPMTGEISMLPPLSGDHCPGHYVCAILTGDDLDVPAPSGFFRVLLVYNRRSFTALRSCSSADADAGVACRWGPEERKPGGKISANMLRGLGHAVVVGGAAYWPMHHEAFGVRLDGPPSEPMDMCPVPYRQSHYYAGERLLGTSPDGKRLSLLDVGFLGCTDFCINIETQTAAGGEWEGHEQARLKLISLPELGITMTTAFKLRWFGEKSGTVIFTVGEGGGCTSQGVFILNITTRCLEKVADGVECHAWKYLCGYEMDREALFASSDRSVLTSR
ncbi:hypothetical protein CFC21_091740 [Triticum aestivum]|uniref:DUF7595 domain-containing protein n=2 Tax=Triticum aestivum TaxID=4565 RepID=A0A9R1LGZ2_WHEAT|nr:uncharacterized protein LOC123141188 [Triticum aestivum]KAF7088655.1 hypothetical protein CFC21_091740 [Triticum aestivum]